MGGGLRRRRGWLHGAVRERGSPAASCRASINASYSVALGAGPLAAGEGGVPGDHRGVYHTEVLTY